MNPKKLLRKVAPKKAVKLAEETYRRGRVETMQILSGRPARKLRVIAVTGTNGKTTTCCIINDILVNAGYKTALFTTAVIEVAGKRELNTVHRTVPLTADLVSFLKKAKTAKVDFVILETTSHALHQHKMTGIPIEVAVMTNLTQDHLDYHGSMQAYANAKARLFNNYMKPKYCVLNADDEWFDFFRKSAVGNLVDYGKHAESMKLESFKQLSGSAKFKLGWLNLSVPLTGEFNVYNAAAAASVAKIVGLNDKQIATGLLAVKPIPGRLEAVEAGQKYQILVDYAHTPDALENVLTAVKHATPGKLRLVFGATGDRDKSKRPIMGEIAARLADKIYLTDDETYSEDGDQIRREVMLGIKKGKGGSKTTEIGDRYAAIVAAIGDATKGDTILLTGIGHQDYRQMGDNKLAWREADVVREILKSETRQ